jgi:hypothetical protein
MGPTEKANIARIVRESGKSFDLIKYLLSLEEL